MTISKKIAILVEEKNVSSEILISSLRKYMLLPLLPSIQKHLEVIAKEKETRSTLVIESPFTISEDSLKTIMRVVGEIPKKHMVVIKKSILAGFKARYKGKLYDGSAERIIEQFTKQ